MTRFENYEQTVVGRRLSAIVTMPELIAEYCALSRIGRPAVQACAQDVAPIIEAEGTREERAAANQFVGWRVARIMRGLGYELVHERGRVNNAPYRTGAVWALRSDGVTLGYSVPSGVTRQIRMTVKEGSTGVVADIDAIDSANNPPRRVHVVVGMDIPINEARDSAVRYAERHGYGHIQIIDHLHLADDFLAA